jgi:hypothetical protein
MKRKGDEHCFRFNSADILLTPLNIGLLACHFSIRCAWDRRRGQESDHPSKTLETARTLIKAVFRWSLALQKNACSIWFQWLECRINVAILLFMVMLIGLNFPIACELNREMTFPRVAGIGSLGHVEEGRLRFEFQI